MRKNPGWLMLLVIGAILLSGSMATLGVSQVRDINIEIQGTVESSTRSWIDGRFEMPIYTIGIAGFEARLALEKANLTNLCFGTGIWIKPFSCFEIGAGMGLNYIDFLGETEESYSKSYLWAKIEDGFVEAYVLYDVDANRGKSKIIKLNGELMPARPISLEGSLTWSRQPTEEYYQERYILYLDLDSSTRNRIYAGYQVFGLGTNQDYLNREVTRAFLVGQEWQFGYKSILREISIEGRYWERSAYVKESAYSGSWEEDSGIRIVVSGTVSF